MQCAVPLKHLFICKRLLSGHLQELKNKRKVQLGDPKSGRGPLWERSLTRARDKTTLLHLHIYINDRPGTAGSKANRGGPGTIKINEIC